jgi:xanthine dehydrogenase accessory factor
MRAWLTPLLEALDRSEAAMLVHVAELKGSGPREVGAQMLVTETAFFGTIGGGELEHSATLKARQLLESGRAGLVRYALGPELNQCCGGSVALAFEPFAPADRAWVQKLGTAAGEPEPVFRTLRVDAAGTLRRDWARGGDGPDIAASLSGDAAEIRERVNPPAPALWLFGAGHVGRALAYAVAPLGFAVTWVDGRAGQFPERPPAGIKTLALAMPELAVDEAPPDTSFLVMTHSHPLDEAVCEAVLRRDNFAYLGLIGSATKRARFAHRLERMGFAPGQIERMTCPIGIGGIVGKEPAVIAASVVAQLLQLSSAQPPVGAVATGAGRALAIA